MATKTADKATKTADKEEKQPFHVMVAERLIKQLEEGTAPLQRPWEPGAIGSLPMNPTTGKRYKGINSLHLMMQGRSDPRWMTYKQASAEGAQVRRGERGTLVQYWKFDEERTKTDEQGRPVIGKDGQPEKERFKLERPKVFMAVVFNAEQIDGLPAPILQPMRWDAVERAESILKASGASINHAPGDSAYYRPSTDSITLPYREQFKSSAAYYATALHELGHWTGHESRLARDLNNPFGSEAYAKEELRAEIASMIVGDQVGIGRDPGQHAAYVKSWVRVLKDDPMEILRASSDAEKIHDFVMAFEQKQVQDQTENQAVEQPIVARTAALYQAMNEAEETFRKELVRVYGEDRAGDARYKPHHEDAAVQQAATDFVNASEAWHSAVEESRQEQASPKKNSQAAELREALAVDIDVVLNDPALSFTHYQANQGIPTGLADSLRAANLETVLSVTGPDPERFMESAIDRLSPIFDMKPEDTDFSNAYLERKGLAQAFALKAESLVENITRQQNQEPAMTTLPEAQTESVVAALESLGWSKSDGAAIATKFFDSINVRKEAVAYLSKGDGFNRSLTFQYTSEGRNVAEADGVLIPVGASVEQASELAAQAATRAEKSIHESYGVRIGAMLADPVKLLESYGEQVQDRIDAEGRWNNGQRLFAFHEQGGEPVELQSLAELEAYTPDQLMALPSIAAIQREEQAIAAKEDRKANEYKASLIETTGASVARLKAAVDAKQYQEQNDPIQKGLMRDMMALEVSVNLHYLEALEVMAPKVLDDVVASLASKAKTQTPEHGNREYIDVPFKQKDEAKKLGAKWDRAAQSWYVPPGVNPDPFTKWAQKGSEASTAAEQGRSNTEGAPKTEPAHGDRLYLAVPYAERMEAKAAGAAWDKAAKSWYVGPNADTTKLERWRPENVKQQQDPAMPPRDEFANALRAMQCVVDGAHPIMDGQRHRIKVIGDNAKEAAGFYVGHLDGHPAGYIKNNRSGEELRWKSTGYSMTDTDKAQLRAEAAEKLAERSAQQEQTQSATADRLAKQLTGLKPVEKQTAYMEAKGIAPQSGAFTDAEGQKTYIPAMDAEGKVWTMQYIQDDGTKRFAKDSRKEGCFHVVGGGLDSLANAPALVIAEGYATAATLAEVLGQPTVAAFDSGNLKAVAVALNAKFPDKPVIVAGDDDRHLPMTLGNNPGKEKAIEAAAAVGGQAVFPVFAPGEAEWPEGVNPITPDAYKKHQAATTALEAGGQTPEQATSLKAELLSREQLDALAKLKRHTDFNDLASRSTLSREGVMRQANAATSLAIEQKHELANKQQQARAQDEPQEQRPRRAAKIG